MTDTPTEPEEGDLHDEDAGPTEDDLAHEEDEVQDDEEEA